MFNTNLVKLFRDLAWFFILIISEFVNWEKQHKKRVHKGFPLFNYGVSLFFQDKEQAIDFIIAAYAEDSIRSTKIGNADKAPASKMLRGFCGVWNQQLRSIDSIVSELKEKIPEDNPQLSREVIGRVQGIIEEIKTNYNKYLSNTWKLEIDGQHSFAEKNYSKSFQIYKELYQILMEYQSIVNHRIHKGHPLFNMGLSLFYERGEAAKPESKELSFLSYIEDCISSQEINDVETEASSLFLRTQLGVDSAVLDKLGNFVVSKKIDEISPYPDKILSCYIFEGSVNDLVGILSHLPKQKKKKKLDIFNRALKEQDSNKKGQLLVDLLVLMIDTDLNFEVGKVDVRTKTEQIDIEIHNKAIDAFLKQLNSMIILVELKNWTKDIGSKEMRDFITKVINRPRLLCNLGLFITASGFTQPAKDELLRHSGKNYAIATIDGKDLKDAVTSCKPFSELLKNALLAAGRA